MALPESHWNFLGDFSVLPLIGDELPPLVGDLVGEPDGESPPPLMGDDSLIAFPTNAFCMATFSENFFSGSFLSNFSNSAGVY